MSPPDPESPGLSGVGALPPELLSHIFTYLSSPPPSDTRLHGQPSANMLETDPSSAVLKAVSLVSRRWRLTVLPLLFQHVVWAIDRRELLRTAPSRPDLDPVAAIPLLSFLRAGNLARCVKTLTLVVGDRTQGLYRLSVPDHGSGASPEPAESPRGGRYSPDSNWLWELLFGILDPYRFTLIASPRVLASLLSRMLFVGDAWSFRNQCHILSLSTEDERFRKYPPDPARVGPATLTSDDDDDDECTAGPSTPTCHAMPGPIDSVLFKVRPWTSLLLNEGSHIPVYKTYEFFLKRPPSTLGALLGCEEPPNNGPMIPPTVHSLSYIAMFPLSSHFNSLVAHLPPLDRLYVQLVPRNGILDDPEEMHCVDAGDLWTERNTCYSLVMRSLCDGGGDADEDGGGDQRHLGNNWLRLREFISGDAADKEAWNMAVHYVQNMSRSAWRVEREGVFIKDPSPGGMLDNNGAGHQAFPSDGEGLGDAEDDGPLEIFKGCLERLAFNGIAPLPYPPMAQDTNG